MAVELHLNLHMKIGGGGPKAFTRNLPVNRV